MSYIYKKLVSLNLMMLILCSIIYVPVYAESGSHGMNIEREAVDSEVLIVDGQKYDPNEDAKGNGWTYWCPEAGDYGQIYLENYSGSGIIYNNNGRDLLVDVYRDNIIKGNDTPAIQNINGNLEIDIYGKNTMDLYAGDNNSSITAKEIDLRAEGDSDDVLNKNVVNIFGSKNVSAVKADKITLSSHWKSGIKITGGINGSAIEVTDQLKLYSGYLQIEGNNAPAITCSENDRELYCYMPKQYFKYYAGSGIDDNKEISVYNGEQYLRTESKESTFIVDANGGNIEGKKYIEIQSDLADGLHVRSYDAVRDGYILDGWYYNNSGPYNAKTKCPNNSPITADRENEKITIYARWLKVDPGDVLIRYNSQYNYGVGSDGSGDYLKCGNSDEAVLPSIDYKGSSIKPSEAPKKLWIDDKYNFRNNGYKELTDINGTGYWSFSNGIYTPGSTVDNDKNRVRIFDVQGWDCIWGSLFYYLGDGRINGNGNVIDEWSYTSGDLTLYVRDDTDIEPPEGKKLLGWSLSKDLNTLDYMPGDIIRVNGMHSEQKNLYAIWVDKDWNNNSVIFRNIDLDNSKHYAAFYNIYGKMIRSQEINVYSDNSIKFKLNKQEYYNTYEIKLFTFDGSTLTPTDPVKTAIKNSKGEFEVTA